MTFAEIIDYLNGIAWGPWMLILLVGTGIYLTVRVGFIQFGKFGYVMKNTIGKLFKKQSAGEGEVTPLQAVSTAWLPRSVPVISQASPAPSRWAVPAQCSGCGYPPCSEW